MSLSRERSGKPGSGLDYESVYPAGEADSPCELYSKAEVDRSGPESLYSAPMALTPGTRLGPYEIISALGAGGMGEVYQARDTRLDRTVAIKVLPKHLAERPDLRQRLDREARAISSLSHAHICALYDVGHQDGVDFLVMEYLEGETLAQRLSRGRLPAAEVVRFGAQAADALAAAHRSGIIHRDLKPGNIMLTRSGVKVLDFGLAKTASQAAGPVEGVSRTIHASQDPLTAEGTILGTFQYMAPEQLEGKEADARTDLFALGTILYEMATGRRAFDGQSQASLIASILKEEPRSMTEIEPLSPPALERVVRACLAKHPDDRIQTAQDLKLQLHWIAEGGSQLGVAVPDLPRRRNRGILLAAPAVVLALAGGILLGTRLAKPKAPPAPTARVSVIVPDSVTPDREQVNLSISPDGSMIAFVAADSTGTSSLWLRPLDSPTVRPLKGTEKAALPFWSPDSRTLAFFADGKLKRIPESGGAAQVICEAPDGRGGTWSGEDVIVFSATSAGPLSRVPAGGGSPVPVTELDVQRKDRAHRFPCFLPDGRHFLYVVLAGTDSMETRLGSIDDPKGQPLFKATSSTRFAEPGYLLYQQGSALLAQRFDAKGLRPLGSPVSLPDNPGGTFGYGGSYALTASSTGTLLYHTRGAADSRLLWMDRSGRILRTIVRSAGSYGLPAIAPDGTRAVVGFFPPDGNADIWVVDLERGLPIRLTHAPGLDFEPTWSPDSREIVFTSNRGGTQSLYRLPAGGGREPTLFLELDSGFNNVNSWSRDGRFIVFRRLSPETGDDLWLLPMEGPPAPKPLLVTPFDEDASGISPDGHWLAYRSNESGRHEIYVQSFPDGGDRLRISTEGTVQAKGGSPDLAWRSDGGEIYFLAGDAATVMAAPVVTQPTFRAGTPRPLFKLPRGAQDYAVSADGQHFLVCAPGEESSSATFTVVLNWNSALESRP